MDIKKLKAELESGAYPDNPKEAAAQLNLEIVPRFTVLSSATLLAWAGAASPGEDPRIVKIKDAAASHPVAAIRGAAIVAEVMVTNRDETELNLNKPEHAALLAGLVQGGVLSLADKTDLETMATEYISRAEEIGIGWVRPGEVTEARNA